jgi:hypothetical protein
MENSACTDKGLSLDEKEYSALEEHGCSAGDEAYGHATSL